VLAEVLSNAGLTQLHIAETEKYAHVTFFFNGGRETPFAGEIRRLVPSPKDVETYDQKPQMSAYDVVECFEQTMAEQSLDFVILNFANPDMVGHTGNLPATIEAVEYVDRCLGRVLAVLEEAGAGIIVTADHGNAEDMLEPDGSGNTAHSTNKVPLVVLDRGVTLRDGAGLSDFAGVFGGVRAHRDDGTAAGARVNNSLAYTKEARLVVPYPQRSARPMAGGRVCRAKYREGLR
jgi:2,3-bisphosphoglycerate-independent phosphoglycerate mutase